MKYNRHHLKILHLASTKRLSGVAEPMVNMAFYQKALGHDTRVACTPGRSLERFTKQSGINFFNHLHLNSRINPVEIISDFRSLRNFFHSFKPDIIHCHLLHVHWLAALALLGNPKNAILIRSTHRFKKPYNDPVHRWLFVRSTDGVIVPSHAMKDIVLNRYQGMSQRVFMVYGGVNLERFHPRVNGVIIRKKLGIPLNAPLAGIVARLRKDRGFHLLFESLPTVFRSLPEFKLVIVGRGEMEGQINKWIKKPPYSGRVFMAGYHTVDLPNFYKAMDVSLFLGLGSEGGCRAVMEAMSTGIPVIGIKQAVVPEIIDNGINGFLIPPNDKVSLSKSLIEVLSDIPRSTAIGNAARKKMEKQFSLFDKAQRLVRIYEKLLYQK